MVYHDAFDVQVSLLHNDDQMIIIVKVDSEGVLLGEDDINPCFLLRASREAMGYYVCRKHLHCVLPPRRSRVVSTCETYGVGI